MLGPFEQKNKKLGQRVNQKRFSNGCAMILIYFEGTTLIRCQNPDSSFGSRDPGLFPDRDFLVTGPFFCPKQNGPAECLPLCSGVAVAVAVAALSALHPRAALFLLLHRC